MKGSHFIKCISTLFLLALPHLSDSQAMPGQTYKTKLSGVKGSEETGALLFRTNEEVTECFTKLFFALKNKEKGGFTICEASAKAILKPGMSIEVLQKYDDKVTALVRILEGEHKDSTGFLHEVFLDPSPWQKP